MNLQELMQNIVKKKSETNDKELKALLKKCYDLASHTQNLYDKIEGLKSFDNIEQGN